MATFYGTVKGSTKLVSRTGSRLSGIRSSVQSWAGSVITELSFNNDDELMVSVSVADCSDMLGAPIFYGTLEEFKNKLKG